MQSNFLTLQSILCTTTYSEWAQWQDCNSGSSQTQFLVHISVPRSTCRSLKLPSTTLYSRLGRTWLLIAILCWPLRLYMYTLHGQITQKYFAIRRFDSKSAVIMACVHMWVPCCRKGKKYFFKVYNVFESEASRGYSHNDVRHFRKRARDAVELLRCTTF